MIDSYRLDPTARLALRAKHSIHESAFVIGKVGRADLWKWDDTIIDIVPRLIADIPHLHVVVRALPPSKINRIRKLGIEQYFTLLPETVDERDIMETYQLMDTMVHTSRIGETFGIALAEAQALEIPILSRSTDFMRPTIFERDNAQMEIIRDGVTGWIENDLGHMAERVIALSRDEALRAQIGTAGRAHVIESYRAEVLTERLETILAGRDEPYNMQKTFDEYRRSVPHEGFAELIHENTKALYEARIAPMLG